MQNLRRKQQSTFVVWWCLCKQCKIVCHGAAVKKQQGTRCENVPQAMLNSVAWGDNAVLFCGKAQVIFKRGTASINIFLY